MPYIKLESELITKLNECFAEADKRPKNMIKKTKLTSLFYEKGGTPKLTNE